MPFAYFSYGERDIAAPACVEPNATDNKADRTSGILTNTVQAAPVRIIATVDTSRTDGVAAPVEVAGPLWFISCSDAARTPNTFEVPP